MPSKWLRIKIDIVFREKDSWKTKKKIKDIITRGKKINEENVKNIEQ